MVYQIKGYHTSDLKPYHIQQILDAHPDRSVGYKAGMIQAIKQVFNWGEKQAYVTHSPLRGLQKPRALPRDQVLTAKEFAQALAQVPNSQFKDLAKFVWYTGCRPQEAVRVEARHFDKPNGRLIIPPPEAKGKARPRIIYLPPNPDYSSAGTR